MKKLEDVTNPPAGWTPDKTFVKRTIHFGEPPSDVQNPFVRMSVEMNDVVLDKGERGSLTTDLNLAVRVDEVGVLALGPILLDADLETAKQTVEVTFQAAGRTTDGRDRPPVRFSYTFDNQAEPRYWTIFTGQPDYIPLFKYQVRVIVKGSIFTKGMEWLGPWVDGAANGPFMVHVATPEEAGVTMRSLVPAAFSTAPLLAARTAMASVATGSTPPPATASAPPPTSSRDASGMGGVQVGGWTVSPPSSTREAEGALTRSGPDGSDGWLTADQYYGNQAGRQNGGSGGDGPPPTDTDTARVTPEEESMFSGFVTE